MTTNENDTSTAAEAEVRTTEETQSRSFTPPTTSGAAMTPWTARDYGNSLYNSGAKKLATSAVAPIVAAARGYLSVTSDNHKDYAKEHVGDGRSRAGTQFASIFRTNDNVLIMPWYSAFALRKAKDELSEKIKQSIIQIRPEVPRPNPSGKLMKYEFLAEQGSVLDYHPALTREWLSVTNRTMFAEGLLKGDSTLTAMLRPYATDEELSLPNPDISTEDARVILAGLLDRIPSQKRIGIVSVAGVGNWRRNSDWSAINIAGQEAIIAFDADVAKNWNVWHMANELYKVIEDRLRAEPKLVVMERSLLAASWMATLPEGDKPGLDDFFYDAGTIADIDEMIVSELPAMPDLPTEKRVGEWRVDSSGTRVEACEEVKDESGNVIGADWNTKVEIGGRVLSTKTRRAPTDLEQEKGVFGAGTNDVAYPTECEIELSWTDANDVTVKHNVVGPANILGYEPRDWDRREAILPPKLLLHPEWPPSKGAEWLRAVKSNRPSEIQELTLWSTMGWVPVPNNKSEAFVIGNQVIASSPDAEEQTQVGVSERELTGANRFGVVDQYHSPFFSDESERNALRADIEKVFHHYITTSPWKEDRIAASMLSCALRPAVPLATTTVMYFVGPPQKGKSWSAKTVMSSWQKDKGTWEQSLPGGANDTFASTEQAVAKTPIWVMDDVAPSPDKRKAEMEESKIGELIRAVHNKSGKRRSNHDMSAREVPTPHALLIITGENESSVPSIRERVVSVEFTGLSTENMRAMDQFRRKDLAPARVTAAILRMFIQEGERDGWEMVVRRLANEQEQWKNNAVHLLVKRGVDEGDTTRAAGLVADLALGLHALQKLATLVGLDDIASRISWADDGLLTRIVDQVALGQRGKKAQAPGKLLLSSLADLLATKRAHIANMDDPSKPPIIDDEDANKLNSMFGWQIEDQKQTPRGTCIGYYVNDTQGGEPFVFFNREDAFNEAQKNYSKRIPYGQTASSSWKNVWTLGLIHQRYLDRAREKAHTDATHTFPPANPAIQLRFGTARASGIPVPVDALFDAGGLESYDD